MQPAITRVARFVANLEVPVLLLIAPALLFPTPTRLAVLAVMPIIWWSVKMAGGPVIPRTPMNAAVGLMLVMVGVSLYATFDVRFSLGKVSGVLLGVLLFWALSRWLTTSERVKVGIALFLLAGAALAVIGLLGVNRSSKVSAVGPLIAWLPWAIRGIPGAEEGFNPNAVAGCLVLFVPLQVALLATRSDRWLFPEGWTAPRTGYVLAIEAGLLALTAGTVLLMQSRGAWVGLIAAIVAFLVWRSRRTRLMTAVVGAAVLALTMAVGPERLFDLGISGATPEIANTVAGRVELWSRALDGIRDFPFTGMGMNAFRTVMPLLYPSLLIAPGVDVAHAHNHLLQAALDLGLPGLVAYLWIWLTAAILLVRVCRSAADAHLRAVAGGVGAGLIAHFTFGMTDVIPLGSKVGVLFWLALALTVAIDRVAMSVQPTSSPQ